MSRFLRSFGFLLLIASISKANIEYHLVDPPSTALDLSGSIITDGTLGKFNDPPGYDFGNTVVSFNISVTYSGGTQVFETPTHTFDKDFFEATATDLLIFGIGGEIVEVSDVGNPLGIPRLTFGSFNFGGSNAPGVKFQNAANTFQATVPLDSAVFASISTVPEPNAFLLVGLVGVAAFGVKRWKKRS